jgi:hypothetical protein
VLRPKIDSRRENRNQLAVVATVHSACSKTVPLTGALEQAIEIRAVLIAPIHCRGRFVLDNQFTVHFPSWTSLVASVDGIIARRRVAELRQQEQREDSYRQDR